MVFIWSFISNTESFILYFFVFSCLFYFFVFSCLILFIYSNLIQEVVSNDELAGMTRDDECENFNSQWESVARDHLPTRARIPLSVMADGSNNNRHQPRGGNYYPGQLAGAGGGTRQIEAADVSAEEEQEAYRSVHPNYQENRGSGRHNHHHHA